MSITLNNSDFQCLQDQIVDLRTKNYELAEKNRRSQADFEAAKAKICTLQLKLEEQERDFQVISTTLRREIESVTGNSGVCATDNTNKDPAAHQANNNKDAEDYKAKYKKLLHKAKELQQRYEKSVEIVQQLDVQNKNLNERVRKIDEENSKLKEQLDATQSKLDGTEKEYKENLDRAIEAYKLLDCDEQKQKADLMNVIQAERDELKNEVDKLTEQVKNFDLQLESQAEERRIHERKGLQIVKELKRQLTAEKNRTETLQKRLESLLSEPSPVSNPTDLDGRCRLSTSSSTNGNSSSNGNGSRANQDANSVGSWSFVPVKTTPTTTKSSNPALNETLSLCSIDSEDRETVQQPCDITSEDSIQNAQSLSDGASSKQNLSVNATNTATVATAIGSSSSPIKLQQTSNTPSYPSSQTSATTDGMLIEEQAALVDRLTRLQHDKWMLEEKLSYMEQANSSLSEELASKSDIIRHYFIDQALRTSVGSGPHHNLNNEFINGNSSMSRRISFSNSHLLSDKLSLKKVVDFLKERSLVPSSGESENISREATKKMQLMLEETLIKCLKLQENLDFVTSELNKLKS